MKNLSRFRLITFDVTDTLLQAKFPAGVKYAKTAESLGYGNIDPTILNQHFRVEFKRMARLYPNFGRQTGELHWKDWWRLLLYSIFIKAGTNIPAEDLTVITNTLITQYRTSECWNKCEGTDELLQSLKELGKKIGIISNYDPSLHKIIGEMDLPKFDFVLTSYEKNVLKPGSEIFDEALKLARVTKDQALHIGNTLETDYLGALNAGWSSVHITNKSDKWKEHSNINPDHVYPTLVDFLESLNRDEIKW